MKVSISFLIFLFCLPKDEQHEVVDLRVVTEQMREKLRKLSKSIYNKMKRCQKLEKSTWKNLADVEEHVEEIYRRIDQVTVDLVCMKFVSRKIGINQPLTFENLVLV